MRWFKGAPLLSYLEEVTVASDRNLIDLRFPVQYVIRPNLDFRGFAGTVASGVMRVGDEVLCLPSRQKTRIKSILLSGTEQSAADNIGATLLRAFNRGQEGGIPTLPAIEPTVEEGV
jgi:bifunctional enzyme CysN/CysC